jgi:protein-disulfide isomerase
MSKQFWAIIVGIVIVLVGVFALTGDKSSDNNTSTSKTSSTTNHVEGNTASSVKLVEYGDYPCPYCQTYHATVKQIAEEYKDKVSFQFVHFPLPSLHQNAFAAARAAEAADKQGKFWEMHDLLYTNNDPNGATGWVASNAPSTYFNQYATRLGLNLDQFKKDYASSAVNSAINADMSAGNKLGIDGTPTFILNGKKVTIANNPDDFRKVLDEAIKKASEAKQ